MKRRSLLVLARVALPGVLVSCALAAPAGAATYTTSVSPDPFSYPDSQEIIYRLHITTAGEAERLGVSASAPWFPNGGPFMDLGAMALEGPGTVLDQGGDSGHFDLFCRLPFIDFHGNTNVFWPSIRVEVPANATSTVALPGRPGGHAPWTGMDLAVRFDVGSGTGPAEPVRSQNPQNSGRHGVRIRLGTDPESPFNPCNPNEPLPSVALGTPVLVGGSAETAIAGQLLTIRLARMGEAPRQLATVRVGDDGSFGYLWRPPAPGNYAFIALYESQSPHQADDFSNATTVRIGEPPAVPAIPAVPAVPAGRLAPGPITVARRVRCRGRRCVIVVRGRVGRPAALAQCKGKGRLRVAAGRRRVLSTRITIGSTCRYRAVRRFVLPSGDRRFVTVRVSYLGDTALLPKRGQALLARIRR